jgi:hypothetical protein
MISRKVDAAYGRFKLVCLGSDADHWKTPAAVTDRPDAVLVDGCEAAEDLVQGALLGRGEIKVMKMSGTCSKGDLLCPAIDSSGDARKVPTTAGAFYCVGMALEDGADDQEIAVADCQPYLVGALQGVKTLSQSIAVASFTDNTNTTGYLDMTGQIPAQALVLGWKVEVTAGFAGDTTAVIQVGKSGTLAAFSADTAQSVFAAGTVGSSALAATGYTPAAVTLRITITGGADFTSIKTNGAGAATITIYYIQTA